MDEMTPEEEAHDEEVFSTFIEGMEKFARSMGLYMQNATGTRRPIDPFVLAGTDPVVRPFVTASFVLGDEAFSDRVQHPERYTDDAEIRKIEHATVKSEAEEIMRRFAESGRLFGEDDDEG